MRKAVEKRIKEIKKAIGGEATLAAADKIEYEITAGPTSFCPENERGS